MKIIPILVAIAWINSKLYCKESTNQNLASIYNQASFKATVWGSATNNVQFGIEICSIGPNMADKFKVDTHLYNTSQTNIYGLWKLQSGFRLAMTLRTTDGKEIEKTIKGKSYCKTPDFYTIQYGTVTVLRPQVPEPYDDLIDLRDCFKIRNPGHYVLTIKPNLFALAGYQHYVKFDLPEACVEVNLTQFDLKSK